MLVRHGGSPNATEVQKRIIDELKATKDFKELNVFNLIKEEQERHTEIGREINEQISAGKDTRRDLDYLVVRMLKKIIYSGIEGRDKFILSDFPDNIKQAQEFEENCSKLTAVIFAAGGDESDTVVEIFNNGLSIESIDQLLQKDHRLKTMRSWDESTFNEHLGNKTDWGIVTGQSLSGKTLVAKIVADSNNGKVLDLATIAESIRPSLASEEGDPFEGPIPADKVEAEILSIIARDKNAGENFFYLVDGQHHETVDQAAAFLLSNLGTPTSIITCITDAE